MKPLSTELRLKFMTLRLPSGCHRWLGRTLKIRVNGRLRDVRQVAAELHKGKDTLKICRTPNCIHPMHRPGGR